MTQLAPTGTAKQRVRDIFGEVEHDGGDFVLIQIVTCAYMLGSESSKSDREERRWVAAGEGGREKEKRDRHRE